MKLLITFTQRASLAFILSSEWWNPHRGHMDVESNNFLPSHNDFQIRKLLQRKKKFP